MTFEQFKKIRKKVRRNEVACWLEVAYHLCPLPSIETVTVEGSKKLRALKLWMEINHLCFLDIKTKKEVENAINDLIRAYGVREVP